VYFKYTISFLNRSPQSNNQLAVSVVVSRVGVVIAATDSILTASSGNEKKDIPVMVTSTTLESDYGIYYDKTK
jgi:hypothetical protein